MTRFLSYGLLSVVWCTSMYASQAMWSLAQQGQELGPFKEMYLAVNGFLLKNILNEQQLSTRFDSLVGHIGINGFNLVLLNKGNQPIGCLAFGINNIDGKSVAIIYDIPMLATEKDTLNVLLATIMSHFNVQEMYGLVGWGSIRVGMRFAQLGFQENKEIIIPELLNIASNAEKYSVYTKSVSNN